MIDEKKLIAWLDFNIEMLEGYRRCCNPTDAEWNETKGEYKLTQKLKERINDLLKGDDWWMKHVK